MLTLSVARGPGVFQAVEPFGWRAFSVEKLECAMHHTDTAVLIKHRTLVSYKHFSKARSESWSKVYPSVGGGVVVITPEV